jgi:sulfate permease, SulP family
MTLNDAKMTPARLQHTQPFRPVLWDCFASGYSIPFLKRDLSAGLTVAIVALPLSLAIAVASGLSPDKGLIAAIIGGFLVSALGGSQYQIGGPAGAFIVLVASIVNRHGHDGLLLAMMMGGTLLVLFGFLRLGRFVCLIPHGVLVAFTAGIAAIIAASQIKEAFGLTLSEEPTALVPKLGALAKALPTLNIQATAVFALTLVSALAIKQWKPTWPAFLFAIVLSTTLAPVFFPEANTISNRFGALASQLHFPKLPDYDMTKFQLLIPDALAIAFLGAVESLLSAVIVDKMAGTSHKPDAELVGQGIANIGTAMFGGMCVTGTIARTATNFRTGATTPLSGVFHAAFLLSFMMVAAPLAGYIPLAALAAVLAVVCWTMADVSIFKLEIKRSWSAAFVILLTFFTTIFVDLIAGMVAGCAATYVQGRLNAFRR